MPAQHAAKAAAVLIAVSTAVVPAASYTALELVPASSFVEVLTGPDQPEVRVVATGTSNYGCAEH